MTPVARYKSNRSCRRLSLAYRKWACVVCDADRLLPGLKTVRRTHVAVHL